MHQTTREPPDSTYLDKQSIQAKGQRALRGLHVCTHMMFPVDTSMPEGLTAECTGLV